MSSARKSLKIFDSFPDF